MNDQLPSRSSIEIPRSGVEFTQEGSVWKDPHYDNLAKLPDQDRMEVDATGFFTKRQQSGSYLSGRAVAYPANSLEVCGQRCPQFETGFWFRVAEEVPR